MSASPESTILYVDDYAEIREATSIVLRHAGFKVIEAQTGREALQQAAAVLPQLILLDVELPALAGYEDENGYEVCRRLKNDEATAAIPVLLLSGVYTEGEDRVRGLEGGADAYLCKPVDLDMALKILVNGKTQRPSVCNALESLVVHVDVAADFLPRVVTELDNVELVGDQRARQFGGPRIAPANPEDFAREFLDLKLSIAVVDSLDEAIDHIGRNGTGHTEVIITNDLINARRFQREVDAASVMVNASSRFTDGEMFGFGAEIGISTPKIACSRTDGSERTHHNQVFGHRRRANPLVIWQLSKRAETPICSYPAVSTRFFPDTFWLLPD